MGGVIAIHSDSIWLNGLARHSKITVSGCCPVYVLLSQADGALIRLPMSRYGPLGKRTLGAAEQKAELMAKVTIWRRQKSLANAKSSHALQAMSSRVGLVLNVIKQAGKIQQPSEKRGPGYG
jgi:hypothetical protein